MMAVILLQSTHSLRGSEVGALCRYRHHILLLKRTRGNSSRNLTNLVIIVNSDMKTIQVDYISDNQKMTGSVVGSPSSLLKWYPPSRRSEIFTNDVKFYTYLLT